VLVRLGVVRQMMSEIVPEDGEQSLERLVGEAVDLCGEDADLGGGKSATTRSRTACARSAFGGFHSVNT
jgi:hypothetical protein